MDERPGEAVAHARRVWDAAYKRLRTARSQWMMADSRGMFAAQRRLRIAEVEEVAARKALERLERGARGEPPEA